MGKPQPSLRGQEPEKPDSAARSCGAGRYAKGSAPEGRSAWTSRARCPRSPTVLMDSAEQDARQGRRCGLPRNEDGQASLMIGMMILTFVLFFAFVINTGMLVNAKINLQNAADLAAYAGASVQAR